MEKIKLDKIIKWTGCEKLAAGDKEVIDSVSTDSRSIKHGEFFIPLRGQNFDGHRFIDEAMGRGACGFVVEKDARDIDLSSYSHKIVLSADDNLVFLHRLAYHYIRSIGPTVIGITGSVGKTTTKDMLVAILGRNHTIGYTPRNYNNEIGVPMAILDLKQNSQFFIAELAMRKKGQIAQLSQIISPDVGIITAVGESHLQFFESVKDIALCKAEIASEISENQGMLFLNHDNQWTDLIKSVAGCGIKQFGYDHQLDYNFKDEVMDDDGFYSFDFYQQNKFLYSLRLNIAGYHNIYNASAAAGVSHYLDIPESDIAEGLVMANFEKDRMQIIKKKGMYIISDCYNANPLSVTYALQSLRQIAKKKGARSVAVLADMLELGPDSARLHYQVGKKISENNIDLLITFGKLARNINEGFGQKSYHFKDKQDCIHKIGSILEADDVVLIKGSRANQMEEIIERI